MSGEDFELVIDHKIDQAITLKLRGTLNIPDHACFVGMWAKIAEENPETIIIDLGQLRGVTSVGLNQMMMFLVRLQSKGIQVRLASVPDEMWSLMKLTHMDDLLMMKDERPALKTYAGWAAPVDRIDFEAHPPDMINLNFHKRSPTSPHQGFGRLWLRRYRIRIPLSIIGADALMERWRSSFGSYWPSGNRIYFDRDLKPGAQALINLRLPGGLRLATGAVVSYVSERSFALMTVQGHMFSGWITFCCSETDEDTIAEVQALVRPGDPLYELSFRLGFGPNSEDAFWMQTLETLALTVNGQFPVKKDAVLIDRRLQWTRFFNLIHNAGISSSLYLILTPLRLVRKLFKKEQKI